MENIQTEPKPYGVQDHMNNITNALKQQAQAEQIARGGGYSAPPQEIDPGKWELDTAPWLDKVYHEMLGETLEGEVWTRDESKIKIMNEAGASEFINECSSRISIHMQMSDLSEVDIIEIASRSAEIYADKLEDNWKRWEISPTTSNFESIGQKLYDLLFITLCICRSGGMKKHREKTKNPYANIPQQQDLGGI